MSIIDRYICQSWFRLFLLCLGGFVTLYLVIDLIEKIPRFLHNGGAATDILEYFIWKFPEMIGRTANFAILMATLLTLSTLSRDSEIIALRSCGFSQMRISAPLLVIGCIASALLFINAELILPPTYARTEFIERVKIKKMGGQVAFKRNNIWFRSNSMILQARMFEPTTRTLNGVVVWEVDGSMNPLRRIDADSATYQNGVWVLNRVSSKEFRSSGFVISSERSVPLNLSLKIEDLQILNIAADNMSSAALYEYAENLRRGGYTAYRYMTLMHTKIAAPFGAVIMVLLGIPFALRNIRSGGTAMGIGVSIAIGFLFFVINAVLLSYGSSGVLPPVIAAWGANILFMLGGIWLSMTVKA